MATLFIFLSVLLALFVGSFVWLSRDDAPKPLPAS
jgi:hypothetical protein